MTQNHHFRHAAKNREGASQLMAKRLRKTIARRIHLSAGYLVTLFGYCPECLSEIPEPGLYCQVCWCIPPRQLNRKEVFKAFKRCSSTIEKDPIFLLCPECGRTRVEDLTEAAAFEKVECPFCRSEQRSLYRVDYQFTDTLCDRCETQIFGFAPALYEYVKCKSCGHRQPAPAAPLTEDRIR